MAKNFEEYQFKSVASLEPLLRFWETSLVPECSHMASMFKELKEKIDDIPELHGDIEDISILQDHYDILTPLMSAVLPPASFHTEIAGALMPYTMEPFYATPRFQELFIKDNRFLKGKLRQEQTISTDGRVLRAYFMILDKIYGIKKGIDTPIVREVEDANTGLMRYFRILPDFQFVDVVGLKSPRKLTKKDRVHILDNITDINVLEKYIDVEKFQFSGFTIARAMDVTEPEVISSLEKDLIDQHSIFSSDGIKRLEDRMKILFRRPDLKIGIGASQGDKVLIVKSDCEHNINCLFANSQHVAKKDLEGSIWTKAIEKGSIIRIPDLKEKKNLIPVEEHAVAFGLRSILISPLIYQGEPIGILEIFSKKPNALGSIETLLLEQITPIFSVALKRGVDELAKSVQAIIKEKCTAVHPSVEWRFEKAAMNHMEKRHSGISSEIEPIIFKDVVPFYGQSDIRGSSYARNQGIQKDLTKQLTLAYDVMQIGSEQRPWPLLEEYKYRIEKRIEDISAGINSGDETGIFTFLNNEVSPTFGDLMGLGSGVVKAVEAYRNAIDPVAGIVYEKRRDYEESVSKLNNALSSYLDQEDAKAQESFPHYFEKRQTDGVDYMMYVGASMNESGELAPFHIKNLTLWQLMLACGMAWHTAKVKRSLKVPLDTCHLMLVNHTPLSIRFRFDEKRFDVDGAYDVRHEIIKSRLDKALIKGTGERLTQPGRIAVVYSNPMEGKEIQRHVDFLMAQGKLHDDLEFLNLDDLPEVRGLKALRVGVDLEAMEGANIIEMRAG
ncbi:MAG: GAF domain-containing protein [Desulfobacteraceae bacterium]|nr:GAF domain-containing protein [Desulfobacteraceae bacterium]